MYIQVYIFVIYLRDSVMLRFEDFLRGASITLEQTPLLLLNDTAV